MSKLVYICAPYSGDIEKNIEQANKYAKFVYRHGFIPIAPHNLFPFIKNETSEEERKWALFADLAVLEKCDILVLCSKELTAGMRAEVEYANEHDIRVTFLDDIEEA